MQLITDEYRKLNSELHSQNKNYGTVGALYAYDLVNLLRELNTQDVLDYGCGKGTLQQNLPFTIHQYDPAISKHADLPSPADVVICTDVLEHIEPNLLPTVLQHLCDLTKRKCYVTACTREAKKTLPDGRNAHLIIQPKEWWIDQFLHYFKIDQLSYSDDQVIAILEPKARKKETIC